jgi:23S rRNA (cytidine1920-2'-O)/16S rRNA (cytidine1409-2'-O)-methyltransferase
MKQRLDVALVERGLAPSRAKAQELVRSGAVSLNGAALSKVSHEIAEGDDLQVLEGAQTLRYVSRGGLKLESALAHFRVDATNALCLDLGASTGGFCDCLLQHGARGVVAIDVGHSQLHAKLLADARVENRENVNARVLNPSDFPEKFDIVVADLSFISLTKILPVVPPLAAPGAWVIALVKPQFEAGPQNLNRSGIVRHEGARKRALNQVLECGRELGWNSRGTMESPTEGGDGNREWLACWKVPEDKVEAQD